MASVQHVRSPHSFTRTFGGDRPAAGGIASRRATQCRTRCGTVAGRQAGKALPEGAGETITAGAFEGHLSGLSLFRLFSSVATIREWLNPGLRIAAILLVRVRAQTLLARQVTADLRW
jgi:hypothetical protein